MKQTMSLMILFAGSAGAQDATFVVQETTQDNLYVVFAQFLGSIPANSTSLDTAWADTRFRITGDAPITFQGFNPAYRSDLFGDPEYTGDGTTQAEFQAIMLGSAVAPLLGSSGPDSSNPLLAASFHYDGSPQSLGFSLFGQNSAIFEGDPSSPFGRFELYLDALGNPGSLSFNTSVWFGQFPVEQIDFFIPAPGTLALTPLALIAARRRRVGLRDEPVS